MTSETNSAFALTYQTRRSKLEPHVEWQLTKEALICRDVQDDEKQDRRRRFPQPWPELVLFGEIAAIRLSFDPTRMDVNRYHCDLQGPGGIRTTIVSTSYVGFASFENRGAEYSIFIRELVRRVQLARPSVTLTSGLSWPSYIFQHGLVLLALIVLATVLGIAGVPAFGSIFVKAAIVVLYCAVLWRYARLNLPRDLTLPPLD